MDLPLTLQMEIDISAAAHKREIADGFARLRAKLLPPPVMGDPQKAMNAIFHSLFGEGLAASQAGLNWTQNLPNALMAANNAGPAIRRYGFTLQQRDWLRDSLVSGPVVVPSHPAA